MALEFPKDKWSGSVQEVVIGATAVEGGTRSTTVKVGGETTMPFVHFEAETPNPPRLALEIKDFKPEDWSTLLLDVWGEATNDPGAWAKLPRKLAQI